MSRIESFEQLISWQKARVLTGLVYSASKQGKFAADFALRDQIRRASVSILSNIAEGFERDGDREFRQFLSHAKGSCAEVRAQSYVAFDQAYISKDQFAEIQQTAVEVSRLISGMMTYLVNSDVKGRKFKEKTSSHLTQDSRLKTLDSL